MSNTINERIAEALAKAKLASHSMDAYAYLPDIIAVLEQMQTNLKSDLAFRSRLSGGLGRLVTELNAFADSPLGLELMVLANDFAS